MIFKVVVLLNQLAGILFHDRGIWKREKSHLRGNRKDCTVDSINLFFLRATLNHRIQINSRENTGRYGFITWNSKGCSESLRPRLPSHFNSQKVQSATQTVSSILCPWLLMCQHQFA